MREHQHVHLHADEFGYFGPEFLARFAAQWRHDYITIEIMSTSRCVKCERISDDDTEYHDAHDIVIAAMLKFE